MFLAYKMNNFNYKRIFSAVFVILLVVLIDQASKYYMLNILHLNIINHIEISKIFDFTMVWNRGISFGTFKAETDFGRWALVASSSIIATGFLYWLGKTKDKITFFALSFVIGGAIGNLIDRVKYGAVVDFLDFSGIYFPWVFNIADSAVFIGAMLLIIDMLLNPDEKPQKDANLTE